jgi:outer membrane protein TolC
LLGGGEEITIWLLSRFELPMTKRNREVTMRGSVLALTTAVLTSGVGLAKGAHAQPSESASVALTLPEVIKRTLEHDPKGQAAQARLDEATATRESVRGNLGPKLQVDATMFYWNEPHEMTVVDKASLSGLDPTTLPAPLLPLLGQISKPIRFRDERTTQVQVSLVQPITPLYSVVQGQRAARQGELAAEHQDLQTQREATFRATEAYYRVLNAQHLCQVADEAVTTLRAHLDQAKQFRDADMLGLDEYLSVEVEVGNAVENQIKAKVQRQLATAALATLMGWSEPRPLTLVDVPEEAEPPQRPSLDEARRSGLEHRSEIASLQAMAQASHHQSKGAWWQLTPQISAVGRYQHTTGSAMNSPNEWLVGGMLSWNLWDWGATYYKARAAEAQTRQIQAKDQIDLEIQQRFLAIEAARERLSVARMTLRQSVEALRVARMKFEQHVVSSTTVLDAQTRHMRAQANRISAQYDLILTMAALRLAMGEGVAATVLPSELVLAGGR